MTHSRSDRAPRRPPAYQEYGSDLLAIEAVRLMSLAERGLLATMRWAVWRNDHLPRDPKQLARVLGLDEREVREALTERVLTLFASVPDKPERLHSPELSSQMARLLERQDERSSSGRKGGKSSAIKRKSLQAEPQAELEATPKLTEKSRNEKNRTALCKEADVTNHESANASAPQHDEWISDYSAQEKAERYRRASRGQ